MRTPPRNARTPIEPIAQGKWMIAAGRDEILPQGRDAGRVLITGAPCETSAKWAPPQAGIGWIQNEFMRIAAGLDRIAEAKEALKSFRPRSLAESTPEQLHGLARAYRDLGACATTEWTRRSFDRIADELTRRAGADD